MLRRHHTRPTAGRRGAEKKPASKQQQGLLQQNRERYIHNYIARSLALFFLGSCTSSHSFSLLSWFSRTQPQWLFGEQAVSVSAAAVGVGVMTQAQPEAGLEVEAGVGLGMEAVAGVGDALASVGWRRGPWCRLWRWG